MNPEFSKFAQELQKIADAFDTTRTIFIHPSNVAAFQTWLDAYEYKEDITIVPSEYVERDKAYIVPTRLVQLPAWLKTPKGDGLVP